jgi:glycosyltransferase involved in cell wall biosynthesis
MEFYINEIHEKVKKKNPDVRLFAIGMDKGWLNDLRVSDSSVEPLGFVDDVRPYLDQAVIGICPIRYGSGTRIKLMTYMAAGLPVVSTRKGAEGVDYVDGNDIVLADNADDFAEAISKMLNNQAFRDEIARNGREFVLKNYDWNVIGKELVHIYQDNL